MGYFSQDDIQALSTSSQHAKTQLQQHFQALHKKVFEQIKLNDVELAILRPNTSAVTNDTISDHESDGTALAVQYTRARGQAVTVERLMGREEVASVNNLITSLHPVIEMRLSPTGFAIELIMSPNAWWDQQNLKGKLSVARHRHEFYSQLMKLPSDYCMGFWEGIHLSDMKIDGKYFQHPRILDEWLSTFHPHSDWFRIGIWYDVDDEVIDDGSIVTEAFNQIQTLYELYTYFIWTSDNNFREFVVGNS